MAADISKHLDRAKRFLEKNRVEDAIEAYLAVLDEVPQHQEATQALGDLYARIDQPDRAAVYYGLLFDLLVEPKDESKALAIYNRFLRVGISQQLPERIARYAFLQQKQNHPDEAIEQYTKAAELFTTAGRNEDALFCSERIAQLDPENLARQLRLAEAAEGMGKTALAVRAFLRAGQLASASGAATDALHLLGRAYKLAPQERSVGLLYAQANLQAGNAVRAAALLEPFASSETDAAFVATFGDALMRSGNLERARELLERLLQEKNEGMTQLFDLADRYVAASQDQKAVEILLTLKRRMFADKRQNDFAVLMDGVGAKYPHSQAILEFWASIHNELNRESQYFEVLIRLFDLYLTSGNVVKAAESLERLVDIDAYDYRNQERMEQLRGRVDDAHVKRIASRLMKSNTPMPGHTSHASQAQASTAPSPGSEEGRQLQALEDLIVQTEIFLQYSLQNKALERLQRIAAMFPGEEERSARLANLYQMANWWPKGTSKAKTEPSPAPPAASAAPLVPAAPVAEAPVPITSRTGVYSAETLRDLSKISEVNQKIFRQQTPRAMMITDKETQIPAGMLIVGSAEEHKWKPNEAYFLQAIGDQMLMSVSHTRLRSLVRRMGVSDERTGLLSRSSYQSCLLTEADRARTHGTPLALTILQIDRGAEILRQQGESPLERFLEQLARSLQPMVRQNDVAVKYTSWSLAFILPDTTLAGAQSLADKLRRAASGLRPPWDSTQVTLSAGIVEAVAKHEYDSEDIVTDLINRAEFSIEEARKRGGGIVVALETPERSEEDT